MSEIVQPLLQVEHLTKRFTVDTGKGFRKPSFTAVNDVSFSIRPGEILGLVGESGCGKSTLAQLLLRLIKADEGRILFMGEDLMKASPVRLHALRRDMQMVFQDPYDALNPRFTLKQIVAEPMENYRYLSGEEREEQIGRLFNSVGLDRNIMGRYPHQLSGGQRQRLCIARALALNPKFLICDEAVSALDVSIQAQILNLLLDLKEELGLTYLFISHNLSVVKFISDRVGVMYFGRLVELGDKKELFENVRHPYTEALLKAVPVADPEKAGAVPSLSGSVPSLIHPPAGCVFHPRCPYATERCRVEAPVLRDVGSGHLAACHRCEEGGLR